MKRCMSVGCLLLGLALTPRAEACTGITLRAADGACIVARTIEWGGSNLNSRYVVVPRGYAQRSYTPEGIDGMRFTARYGYVGLAVEQKEFVAEGQRRQKEVLERGTLTEDGDVRSFFFVSSVPWVHYSQLQHPAESPDDSNPRISWGKYVTVNGRTTLPVSLFVNHALADGLHISRFFLNLEKELADMTRQWNESEKEF